MTKKRAKKTSRAAPARRAKAPARRAKDPTGASIDALLGRIQRKGERRFKEALANAVAPTLNKGNEAMAAIQRGLQGLDELLGPDDEDDDFEDDFRDEEE